MLAMKQVKKRFIPIAAVSVATLLFSVSAASAIFVDYRDVNDDDVPEFVFDAGWAVTNGVKVGENVEIWMNTKNLAGPFVRLGPSSGETKVHLGFNESTQRLELRGSNFTDTPLSLGNGLVQLGNNNNQELRIAFTTVGGAYLKVGGIPTTPSGIYVTTGSPLDRIQFSPIAGDLGAKITTIKSSLPDGVSLNFEDNTKLSIAGQIKCETDSCLRFTDIIPGTIPTGWKDGKDHQRFYQFSLGLTADTTCDGNDSVYPDCQNGFAKPGATVTVDFPSAGSGQNGDSVNPARRDHKHPQYATIDQTHGSRYLTEYCREITVKQVTDYGNVGSCPAGSHLEATTFFNASTLYWNCNYKGGISDKTGIRCDNNPIVSSDTACPSEKERCFDSTAAAVIGFPSPVPMYECRCGNSVTKRQAGVCYSPNDSRNPCKDSCFDDKTCGGLHPKQYCVTDIPVCIAP